MSDYLYLYGFVPHDSSHPPRALSGINDAAVELLPVGGLQAVISRVPANMYAPAEVEARLQNLDWVAQQGVAHERVVAWFVDHAQILPVSLLTMYSTQQALDDAYFEQEQHLLETMQRLRGLREWDLKVSFDEPQLLQHAASIGLRPVHGAAVAQHQARAARGHVDAPRGEVEGSNLVAELIMATPTPNDEPPQSAVCERPNRGFLVRTEDSFPSRHRRDHGEHGGAGEVEVGEHAIHRFESIARADEHLGASRSRFQVTRASRERLKRPHRGSPYGDDPSGGVGDRFGGTRGDGANLAVHLVVVQVFYCDGSKRIDSDVEGDELNANALCPQCGKDFGSEVKPSRWRGGASGELRVRRLVAFRIREFLVDVRREWSFADPFQRLSRSGRKAHDPNSVAQILANFTFRIAKSNQGAWLGSLAWLYHGFVLVGSTSV